MPELSPAAQAVFWAWSDVVGWAGDPPPVERQALAAALRAAADQVAPVYACKRGSIYGDTMRGVRSNLLAIAAELETFTTENR